MKEPTAATGRGSLSRERLTAAALRVVDTDGIDGLTMRVLANRLGVKAASLYWHVRDRRELLELAADALLADLRLPPADEPWRGQVLGIAAAVGGALGSQRDSARILLEAPDGLERSEAAVRLRSALSAAGLGVDEAHAAASLILAGVAVGHLRPTDPLSGVPRLTRPATVAIDNPSRGVTLRAGTGMETLARTLRASGAGAGVSIDGTDVLVRRIRGTREAVVELNPHYLWAVRVKGGTWRSRLILTDLDVRDIKVDGAAAQIECLLPPPHGVVPISVSGGAVGVRLHRPPGTAATARVSPGALQLRLDGSLTKAALLDSTWRSVPGGPDRYELRISGGALRVELDEAGPMPTVSPDVAGSNVPAEPTVALGLLLDGIERRVAR
jgi:AcrR family transcriptional regulator